jgi:hypothetical protein
MFGDVNLKICFDNLCVAYARVVGEQIPTTAETFSFIIDN